MGLIGEMRMVGDLSIGRSWYLRGMLREVLRRRLTQVEVFGPLDDHYALIERQGRHLGSRKAAR